MKFINEGTKFSLALGLVLLFTVGCLLAYQPSAVAQESYKIGTVLPLTGNYGSIGSAMQKSDILAMKHINEAGGIMGHELKLVNRDTASTPTSGVDAARKLIQVDGVPAYVGAFSSGVSKAIAEGVTIPNKVVQIAQGSTSPMLSILSDDDYFFRACMHDLYQGAAVAEQIYEDGVRNLGIMYANNPYGLGLNDSSALRFEDLGGEVIEQVPYEQGKATYSAEVDRVFSGDVDGVLFITYPEDMMTISKNAIAKGYYPQETPWFGVDAWKAPEVIESVGAENLEGIKGTSQGVLGGPSYETFRNSYQEEFNELPPKPFMEPGYDAVVSIALAIAKSGEAPGEVNSTDIRDNLRPVTSEPGEKVYAGPEELEKAFNLLAEGEDINYIGAAGEVAYDEYGDAASAVQIWQIKDGEFTTFDNVIPEPVARDRLGEEYQE